MSLSANKQTATNAPSKRAISLMTEDPLWNMGCETNLLLLLGRVALVRGVAGYNHQTFQWTICRSVCPVHCEKTADRIRMPFGTIGRTGPGMRQVVGFGDRSTGSGTFGGEFVARHCNQWGLYGVCVRQCLNRRSCGLG